MAIFDLTFIRLVRACLALDEGECVAEVGWHWIFGDEDVVACLRGPTALSALLERVDYGP